MTFKGLHGVVSNEIVTLKSHIEKCSPYRSARFSYTTFVNLGTPNAHLANTFCVFYGNLTVRFPGKGVSLTNNVLIVPGPRMVELYLYSPIRCKARCLNN
jgi:hypothetical protein